jgi:hypothetical protein
VKKATKTLLVLLGLSVGCSSGSPKPTAPPPASAAAPAPAAAPSGAVAAPTPSVMARTDPNVVEETDTYVITRLPKADYIRVDANHIRHPVLGFSVEFFKEDDNYYYVIRQKRIPEEEALKRELGQQKPLTREEAKEQQAPPVPLSDFEDLAPRRVSGRLKLEPVARTGLPMGGMWRASFVLADMNGDGILDVVAPAPRIGDGVAHIWLGDGKGGFAAWPLRFTEDGKPATLAISYGAVAAGDIDGDGKMDFVCATHGSGLVSLFGDGTGGFRIVRKGLPSQDFSAQAVVLVDADGDGRLDIVASRDRVSPPKQGEPVDTAQVRVYLYRGADGWKFKEEGLVGGFYSNSLSAWDFDGDGRKDVLTGAHYVGALTLLWKNMGDGTFSPEPSNAIEVYAYHFATAPGTFGKDRAPAFADAFLMTTNVPQPARAIGITIYARDNGTWKRHRVWREKDGKSLLFALAMGDLDGDGLDDVLFADTSRNRLRVFFQQPDQTFAEMAEDEEPKLDSPGQDIRLGDLDGDGRLDVVVSKTVTSMAPNAKGGWDVYLNRP